MPFPDAYRHFYTTFNNVLETENDAIKSWSIYTAESMQDQILQHKSNVWLLLVNVNAHVFSFSFGHVCIT